MQDGHPSAFPRPWPPLVAAAAQELRKLALNEDAKARLCSDPLLRPFMDRIARRYVAGRSIDDVLQRVLEISRRGHAASADYMGESCRDESKANAVTEVFLALVDTLKNRTLDCSISLDLSHIGSLVDPELGYCNANRIALAAAESRSRSHDFDGSIGPGGQYLCDLHAPAH